MNSGDLYTCKHCDHQWHGDDPRCPDCGRMVVETCITFEEQKVCPWGGPIREGEEAEIQDGTWTWIALDGNDIDDMEAPASEPDSASLDRLLGCLIRKGRK